ncbi:MAG TPA: hypothetical protein VKB38_05740 [Terracidiphilus sp.]|nr:hypothetical protein [Terracidiphilus sp.]
MTDIQTDTQTAPQTAIDRFFQAFQRASADGDMPALTTLFADTFLTAGPQGARCIPAAVFAPVAAGRKQLFDRLGCRPAELVSVTPTPLDSRYTLVRTEWRFVFEPPGRQSEIIPVESTYLLDTSAEPCRILAYIAHHDIMTILRNRGLLADDPLPAPLK